MPHVAGKPTKSDFDELAIFLKKHPRGSEYTASQLYDVYLTAPVS